MVTLAVIALALALLPLGLAAINLAVYRTPQAPPPADTRVSVLIPARNEEANIEGCVRAVLANRDVELDVVVLDDHSEDRTAEIVRALAAEDGRVRLEHAPPLPPGWSGKQHACHVLGACARHDVLMFLDADVRLSADAVGRAVAFLLSRDAGLVSGFPREVAGTAAERLMIPMIHVLLFGYLPMAIMRLRRDIGLGAGCGQLIVCRREAYHRAGGHAAIRRSMHDGVMLPRAFRRTGSMTDLFDATSLASCRMYDGFAALWEGFAKNATEGMATPTALPVWTVLLAGGHVLPWLLLPVAALAGGSTLAVGAAAIAVAANLAFRAALAVRFRQHWLGVLGHPVAVTLMLVLQWQALLRSRRGGEASWRGRRYSTG